MGQWSRKDDPDPFIELVPPEQAEAPENQDPHCVVQSDANPDVYWCLVHVLRHTVDRAPSSVRELLEDTRRVIADVKEAEDRLTAKAGRGRRQ